MIHTAEKVMVLPMFQEASAPGNELEEIADEFVDRNGPHSLGDLDTPAFIRRSFHVTLMPPKEIIRQRSMILPDPKIAALVSVLRGFELSPAS